LPKELILLDVQRVGFREYEEPAIVGNMVRTKSILSGISHGTEMAYYRGTSPFLCKNFNPDKRVFLKGAQVSFPVTLGYENVGLVVETGPDVAKLKKGDLVWLPRSHRETHVTPEDATPQETLGPTDPILLLPSGVKPEQGIFTALATVALTAIHDASIKIGDSISIFGMGAIGLIAIQLAKLDGATKVFAVDPLEKRLQMAESLGADTTLNPLRCDVSSEIRTSCEKGTDVAIECSGSYSALHEAIRSVHHSGNVITLSFYQGEGVGLRLGEEWHHNRITMHSSMGGWGCPYKNYPLWNRKRAIHTVLELLQQKKLVVEPLLSKKIPFQHAAEAYELIDKYPEKVIKVALEY